MSRVYRFGRGFVPTAMDAYGCGSREHDGSSQPPDTRIFQNRSDHLNAMRFWSIHPLKEIENMVVAAPDADLQKTPDYYANF